MVTLIPKGETSFAKASENPSTAHLAAEYGARPGAPLTHLVDLLRPLGQLAAAARLHNFLP